MRWVTVPSVNANNLKTWLSLHLSTYTSFFANNNMGIFLVYNQLLSCKGKWYPGTYSNWYHVMWGVTVLDRQIRLNSSRCWKLWWIFDFSDDKQLSLEILGIMLSLMTKSRIPLSSCSYFPDFSNHLPSLGRLKLCLTNTLYVPHVPPSTNFIYY